MNRDYYSVEAFYTIFGVEGKYAWQREELESLANFLRTNERGCHRVAMYGSNGVGKTYFLALIAYYILWVSKCLEYDSKICMLSGTSEQLKRSINPTLKNIHQNMAEQFKKDFEIGEEKIKCLTTNNVFLKESASLANPHSLSGRHAKDIFVQILDEASIIPDEFYEKILTTLGGARYKIIFAMSNPTMEGGWFYDDCVIGQQESERDGEGALPNWRTRNLVYREIVSPEEFAIQSALIAERHGIDSDFYTQSILGQYPKSPLRQFFPEEALLAFTRRVYDTNNVYRGYRRMGVDISSGDSTDYTVIAVLDEVEVLFLERFKGNANEVVNKIRWRAEEWGVTRVGIDAINMGWVIADILSREPNLNIYRVIANENARVQSRFANRITELYSHLKDWIRTVGSIRDTTTGIQLQRDLLREFRSIRLTDDSNEDIPRLAPKRSYNKSPDMVDAIAHAFAVPDTRALQNINNITSHFNKKQVGYGR
jgi:hypothetical protein